METPANRHTTAFLAALFPPTCILCGAPGTDGLDLCPGCLADLPHNRHCCPRCARPLPPAAPVGSLCGPCQRRPPPYARCVAPFLYRGTLPHLITGLKFQGRMGFARLLGSLLGAALQAAAAPQPQLLIPVPLHPLRLRRRGFNQALEIARVPARALGIPLDTRSCIRQLDTAPQSGLEAKARRRNIRGAFTVTGGIGATHVAIVDDVVTTGSTARELTRALRRAGVRRVEVWAAAKTP